MHWIYDFGALNEVLKCKVYTLRKITNMFSKRPGYEYFSKLDISQQYYTFELDDESKEL